MWFEILGEISDFETIASGAGIREVARLRKLYGRGHWRKRKGVAHVRLRDSTVHVAEVHWYEAKRHRPQGIQDQAILVNRMGKADTNYLVICVSNAGYSASLERRKVYVALTDRDAESRSLLRVIDESGEDYLYPKGFFRRLQLSPTVKKAVIAAA
jgi:hypothetical protein